MTSHWHIARSTLSTLLLVAVGVLDLMLIGSAYGGLLNPATSPWGALLAMTFPGFVLLSIVLLGVLLLCRRRLASAILAIALLICVPAIANYCPVNFSKAPSHPSNGQDFTLLTFNCLWWQSYTADSIASPNPSVQYILDANPDMFATQEGSRIEPDSRLGITAAMVDTINDRYPYQFFTGEKGQMFYSRFPVTRIVSEDILNGTGVCVAYRISIQGHLLTLFNVHLQSIGLTAEDKALYEQLIKARGSETMLREAQNQILSKLFAAFRHRALQAEYIRSLIDDTGGNVIICGDFNDIPGCYAIRTIQGSDLKDAYADAGCGPGISFRANHLYFRIDHMLYRGDFTPLNSRIAHVGASDHYPMLTTFHWNDQ